MAQPVTDRAHGPGIAFGHYGQVEHVSANWYAALFTSSAVYVAIGLVVVLIGTATKQIMAPPPEPVEVKFVEKVLRPEPPPPIPQIEIKPLPAPPKVQPKIRQQRPPAAAAVVPKDMKVRKLDTPPPPKELVAPEEMPQEAPKEVDASLDKGIAVYGEPGTGDPAGLEGGFGDGTGSMVGTFGLPEGAMAPRAYRSNQRPPYPPAALSGRKTGNVLIRCVVRADGRLEEIELVRGDEPFASSALRAMRRWRYEPALYEGQAISAPHVIEFRFKLPS